MEQASPQLYVRGVDLSRALGASLNREYHLGRLGEVQALTDGSGATETDYSVDAWGNVLSGSAAGNPYVYQGGLGYWQEPDLGLNYVRARWLDPALGGWLSVDPVTGEPRYSYARNKPSTRVDPSGQMPPGENIREKQADEERVRRLKDESDPETRLEAAFSKLGKTLLTFDLSAIRSGGEGVWRCAVYDAFTAWNENQSNLKGLAIGTLAGLAGTLVTIVGALAASDGIRRALTNALGHDFLAVLPPSPAEPVFMMYLGGFAWEVGSFILETFLASEALKLGGKALKWGSKALELSKTQEVITVVAAIGAAMMNPRIWQNLLSLPGAWLDSVKQKMREKPIGPYTAGKKAGVFVTTLLSVALIFYGGGSALKQLGPALESLFDGMQTSMPGLPALLQSPRLVAQGAGGVAIPLPATGVLPARATAVAGAGAIAATGPERATASVTMMAAKRLGRPGNEPQRPTAEELRNTPGVATGGEHLPVIRGKWLRGTRGKAGLFPKQIADKLRNRRFRSLREYRSEFWKLVAADPYLSQGWKPQNLANMRNGKAPWVFPEEVLNEARVRYEIHHKKPVSEGGGVYDMDNMWIGTPIWHELSFHSRGTE